MEGRIIQTVFEKKEKQALYFRITQGLENENPKTAAKTGGTVILVLGSIQCLSWPKDLQKEGQRVDLRWTNGCYYCGWGVDKVYPLEK